MSAKGVKSNKMWWYGPEWLLQDPNAKVVEANSESVSEKKRKKHMIFEVSGTAPDENKVKAGKPLRLIKQNIISSKNF